VIGINTWVAFGQNLGFAIHISHALALLEEPSKDLLPLSIPKYARDVENPFTAWEPRVEEMLKDFNSAQYQFGLALQQSPDENAARKIFDTQYPGPKYASRFYLMADSERKTTVAVQALVLACRLDAQTKERVWLKKAVARLGEGHAADKGIYNVLPA